MGSLREAFRNAALAVFNAAGDVIEDSWFYSIGSTVYDASSGVSSATSKMQVVSMLFSAYDDRNIDGTNVLPTDMLGTIPQTSLYPRPTVDDEVQRLEAETSVLYAVVDVKQDPAGAIWKIQLRKP